ncbi:hypothetical protein ACFQH5_20465 [Halomonas salifodinae]|uniref:Uncharacterized protein n=1 Tax=Halomonas salifodinae TaxID=438745 RepID=A0ABW2F423_9GAMM
MSNEPKWTPSPWDSTDHGVGELVVFCHRTEDAICILDDTDHTYAWPDGYSTSHEAVANAHLIAAAPELYECLQAFPGFNSEPEQIAAWAKRCLEVEAKARGEK